MAKKNPYGLPRFNRSPKSMLKQAYLTLANPLLGDSERLRLGTVVSYFRGTFDLLQFVEAENKCRGIALDEIEQIATSLAAGDIKPSGASKEIQKWIKDTRKWRSASCFGIVTGELAEFDDAWTAEIPEGVHPDTL